MQKEENDIKVVIIDYDQNDFKVTETKTLKEIFNKTPKNTCRWVNIVGVPDKDFIDQIGAYHNWHPLIAENISVSAIHKTKFYDYDDAVHVVASMHDWNNKKTTIKLNRLNMVIGSNYLISFVEKESEVFAKMLSMLKDSRSRVRKLGVDYLCYAILDLIVDNFFVIIEGFEGLIEKLEENILVKLTPETLRQIQALKKNLIFLRKSIWLYRELVNALQTTRSELISSDIDIYFKDLYNHIIQAVDFVETFRDIFSGMIEIYMSSVSNEMNKVMKVLTVIATIFIPITFVASIYGMNFDISSPFNMPELSWRYGYLFVLVLMGIIVLAMIFYFKKKKWF